MELSASITRYLRRLVSAAVASALFLGVAQPVLAQSTSTDAPTTSDAPAQSSLDTLQNELGALATLASALGVEGLSGPDVLAAVRDGMSEQTENLQDKTGALQSVLTSAIPPEALAFQEAVTVLLCGPGSSRILNDSNCNIDLDGAEELGDQLVAIVRRLTKTADAFSAAYEPALRSVISDLKSAALIDSDADAWWDETGLPALLALDRIGREYLELVQREGDKQEENARDFVHSRLDALLRRQDVAAVVGALVSFDPAFRPLLQIANDKEAALLAAASVSQWLQDGVALRLYTAVDTLQGEVADTTTNDLIDQDVLAALQPIQKDLGSILSYSGTRIEPSDAAESVPQGLRIDQIRALLEEQRQALEYVLRIASQIEEDIENGIEDCRIPSLGNARFTGLGHAAAAETGPKRSDVNPDRLRTAAQTLVGLADRCGATMQNGLFDLLSLAEIAKASTPDPIAVAQALCQTSSKLGPAIQSFLSGSAPESDIPKLLDMSSDGLQVCSAIERLPSEYENLEFWLDQLTREGEAQVEAEVIELVRGILAALQEGGIASLAEELRARSHEILLAQALFGLEQLASFSPPEGSVSIAGCPEAPGSIGLDLGLSEPKLVRERDKLLLHAGATARLCRLTLVQSTETQVANTTTNEEREQEFLRLLNHFELGPASAAIELDLTTVATDLGDVMAELATGDISAAQAVAQVVAEKVAEDIDGTLEITDPEIDEEWVRSLIDFLAGAAIEDGFEIASALYKILDEFGDTIGPELSDGLVEVRVDLTDVDALCLSVPYGLNASASDNCISLLLPPDELEAALRDWLIERAVRHIVKAISDGLDGLGIEDAIEEVDEQISRAKAALAEAEDAANSVGLEFELRNHGVLAQIDVEKLLENVDAPDISGPLLLDDVKGHASILVPYAGGDLERKLSLAVDVDAVLRRNLDLTLGNDLLLLTKTPTFPNCVEVSLKQGAPIEGRLGRSCWHEGEVIFTPVAQPVVVSVPALDLQALVSFQDDDLGRIIELELDFGLARPGASEHLELFSGVDQIAVEIDLNAESMTLRSGAFANEQLFQNLELLIARNLPGSLEITAITLRADGLVIQSQPELQDFTILTLMDSDFLVQARETLGLNDLSACESARLGMAVAMFDRLKVAPEIKTAYELANESCNWARWPFDIGVNRPAELQVYEAGSISINWECDSERLVRATDDDFVLRKCDVRLPALPGRCSEVRLQRDSDGWDIRDHDNCLESLFAPLIPQDMLDELGRDFNNLVEQVDLFCDGIPFENEGIPDNPETCSIGFEFDLPLKNHVASIGPLFDDCELPSIDDQRFRARFHFDGRVALEEAEEGELQSQLENLATAQSACAATQLFADIDALQAELEGLALRWPIEVAKCQALLPGHSDPVLACTDFVRLLEDSPSTAYDFRGVRLRNDDLNIFGTKIGLVAESRFDGTDFADPVFSIHCPDCANNLNRLADRIAENISDPMPYVSYTNGTASLRLHDRDLVLEAPFTFRLDQFGVEAPFAVDCTIDLENPNPLCNIADGETIFRATITQLAVDQLREVFPRGQFAIGPVSASLDLQNGGVNGAIKTTDPSSGSVTILFNLSMPEFAIDHLGKAQLGINLFDDGFFDFKVSDSIEEQLGAQVADAINDLLGGAIPVVITKITVEPELGSGRLPEKIRVSSAADIAGVFTVSVPDVLISGSGLDVDGPNELTLGFPPGVQIPVTPFTICPTGGTIGSERLVVYTSVTLAECTASALVNIRGSAEIGFNKPVMIVRGNLVLLAFLPLGNAEATLDLAEVTFDSILSIGGVLSDVINYTSEMRIQGNDPAMAKTQDVLQLFRVPVGDQLVEVRFTSGEDGGILVRPQFNLFGFLEAAGEFRSDIEFRRPEGFFGGSAKIGGWTLGGVNARARPDYLRAGFTILGFRMSVVVPGLDALTPDYLARLIEALLTPDFENLDKALEAILKGNITINPIADFGSDGGDGLKSSEGSESADSGAESTGEGDSEGTPSGVKASEAPAAEEGEGATTETLLNPPGSMAIEFEVVTQDGPVATDVKLMEGGSLVSLIARIPNQPDATFDLLEPIYDGSGNGLVFTRESYIHRWRAVSTQTISGCTEGSQTNALFAFSGAEEGAVGYAELCRFGSNANSLLAPANASIVVPFLEALSRAPEAFPDLIPLDPDGVPLPIEARPLLQIGSFDIMRDGQPRVAALLTEGRILVSSIISDAQNIEGARCAVTGAGGIEKTPRTFLIFDPLVTRESFTAWIGNGTGAPSDLDHILGGLNACSSGVVVVQRTIDRSTGDTNFADLASGRAAWMSSGRILSSWEGNRWEFLRERPEPQLVNIEKHPIIFRSEEVRERMAPPPPPAPQGVTPPSELVDAAKTPPPPKNGEAPPLDAIPTSRPSDGTGQFLRLVEISDTECEVQGAVPAPISYAYNLFRGGCLTMGETLQVGSSSDRSRMAFFELEEAEGKPPHLVLAGVGLGLKVDAGPGITTGVGDAALSSALDDTFADETVDVRTLGFDAEGTLAVLTLIGQDRARMHWSSVSGNGTVEMPNTLANSNWHDQVPNLAVLTKNIAADQGLPVQKAMTLVELNDSGAAITYPTGVGTTVAVVFAPADAPAHKATVLVDDSFTDDGANVNDTLSEFVTQPAPAPLVWVARIDDRTTAIVGPEDLRLIREEVKTTASSQTSKEMIDALVEELSEQYSEVFKAGFGEDANGPPANTEICSDPMISETSDSSSGSGNNPLIDRTDCLHAYFGGQRNYVWRKAVDPNDGNERYVHEILEPFRSQLTGNIPGFDVRLPFSGFAELAVGPGCENSARLTIGKLAQTVGIDQKVFEPRTVVQLGRKCEDGIALAQLDEEKTSVLAISRVGTDGFQDGAVFTDGAPLPIAYISAFFEKFDFPAEALPPASFSGLTLPPSSVPQQNWAAQRQDSDLVILLLGAADSIRSTEISGLGEDADLVDSSVTSVLEIVVLARDGNEFTALKRRDGGYSVLVETRKIGADRLMNLPVESVGQLRAALVNDAWRDAGSPLLSLAAEIIQLAGNSTKIPGPGHRGPWPEIDLRAADTSAIARLPDIRDPNNSLVTSSNDRVQTLFYLSGGIGRDQTIVGAICGDDIPLDLVPQLLGQVGETLVGPNVPRDCKGHFVNAGSGSAAGLFIAETSEGGLNVISLPCAGTDCQDASLKIDPIADTLFRNQLRARLVEIAPRAISGGGFRRIVDELAINDAERREESDDTDLRQMLIGWKIAEEGSNGASGVQSSNRFEALFAASLPSPDGGPGWRCIAGPLDISLGSDVVADQTAIFAPSDAWIRVANEIYTIARQTCDHGTFGFLQVSTQLGGDGAGVDVGLYSDRIESGPADDASTTPIDETRAIQPTPTIRVADLSGQLFSASLHTTAQAAPAPLMTLKIGNVTFSVPTDVDRDKTLRALAAAARENSIRTGTVFERLDAHILIAEDSPGTHIIFDVENQSLAKVKTSNSTALDSIAARSIANSLAPENAEAIPHIAALGDLFFQVLAADDPNLDRDVPVHRLSTGAQVGDLPARLSTSRLSKLETLFHRLQGADSFLICDLFGQTFGPDNSVVQRDILLLAFSKVASCGSAGRVMTWHALEGARETRVFTTFAPISVSDAPKTLLGALLAKLDEVEENHALVVFEAAETAVPVVAVSPICHDNPSTLNLADLEIHPVGFGVGLPQLVSVAVEATTACIDPEHLATLTRLLSASEDAEQSVISDEPVLRFHTTGDLGVAVDTAPLRLIAELRNEPDTEEAFQRFSELRAISNGALNQCLGLMSYSSAKVGNATARSLAAIRDQTTVSGTLLVGGDRIVATDGVNVICHGPLEINVALENTGLPALAREIAKQSNPTVPCPTIISDTADQLAACRLAVGTYLVGVDFVESSFLAKVKELDVSAPLNETELWNAILHRADDLPRAGKFELLARHTNDITQTLIATEEHVRAPRLFDANHAPQPLIVLNPDTASRAHGPGIARLLDAVALGKGPAEIRSVDGAAYLLCQDLQAHGIALQAHPTENREAIQIDTVKPNGRAISCSGSTDEIAQVLSAAIASSALDVVERIVILGVGQDVLAASDAGPNGGYKLHRHDLWPLNCISALNGSVSESLVSLALSIGEPCRFSFEDETHSMALASLTDGKVKAMTSDCHFEFTRADGLNTDPSLKTVAQLASRIPCDDATNEEQLGGWASSATGSSNVIFTLDQAIASGYEWTLDAQVLDDLISHGKPLAELLGATTDVSNKIRAISVDNEGFSVRIGDGSIRLRRTVESCFGSIGDPVTSNTDPGCEAIFESMAVVTPTIGMVDYQVRHQIANPSAAQLLRCLVRFEGLPNRSATQHDCQKGLLITRGGSVPLDAANIAGQRMIQEVSDLLNDVRENPDDTDAADFLFALGRVGQSEPKLSFETRRYVIFNATQISTDIFSDMPSQCLVMPEDKLEMAFATLSGNEIANFAQGLEIIFPLLTTNLRDDKPADPLWHTENFSRNPIIPLRSLGAPCGP